MRTPRATLLLSLLTLAGTACETPPPANTRGCYGNGCAIVTTSKYNPDFTGIGVLHTVQFPERTVTANIDNTLDPDLALEVRGDSLWVLNRGVASLRRYGMVALSAEAEIALGTPQAPGPLSSPRDFVMDAFTEKAWVSFGTNPSQYAIGVVDLKGGKGTVKYISIPTAAADPDGSPEPADLYACNGRLYVALQDYTFGANGFQYTGPGRVAIIDMTEDKLLGVIQLLGTNPAQILAAGSDCTQALVVSSSGLTTVADGTGGLERVDLAAGKSLGYLAKDTDLDGRPFSAVRLTDTLMAVGIYFEPQTGQDGKVYLASAKVIAVDAATGKRGADLSDKTGFISFLEVSPDGQLFVGSGQFFDQPEPGKLDKGLYVGPADGTKIPSVRIDLGETPSAIAFHTR